MLGRPKGTKNKLPRTLDVQIRFWQKVDKKSESECWNWTAFVHPSGYGTFRFEGKEIGAHQMAWKLIQGNIPEGFYVCHKCDNRICCNPDHLFLGTAKDNANDRDAKGRTVIPNIRGENHPNSKLSEFDIYKIREMHNQGINSTKISETIGKVSPKTVRKVLSGKSWGWLL